MRNSTAAMLTVVGLAAAWWRVRQNGRPIATATTAPPPAAAILSDLATDPVNLLYLTKPPWMVIPVKPFRSDDREFPKPHRYRDPQGPMAAIYDPTLRSN